jgi:hypothetical protein
MIKTISVENVRGIERLNLNLNIIPNKPSLLVGPNGFGKTSVARAFRSLSANGIRLDKTDHHKGDNNRSPRLELLYCDQSDNEITLIADQNTNSISSYLDICTIGTGVVPKATKMRIGGTVTATASLEVRPITIVDTIPQKAEFTYSCTAARTAFGTNGKIVPNVSSLLEDTGFIFRLDAIVDFRKFSGVRISSAIEAFRAKANEYSGNKTAVLAQLVGDLHVVSNIEELQKIIQCMGESASSFGTEIEKVLAAIEIVRIVAANHGTLTKVVKYLSYLQDKDTTAKLLGSLTSTWRDIRLVEKDGSLVVEFPAAEHLSNGERDVVSFFAALTRTRIKMRKPKGILIIDEIFDYLDDANLVAAQYYLTQMIADYKENDRKLYPIILTHLDPGYFRSYHFKDQKVYHLGGASGARDRRVEAIIIKRDNPMIKESFSRYFVHYDPNDKDLTAEFTALGLDASLGIASAFHSYTANQLAAYLNGRRYDPIATCCAVRCVIERLAYNNLSTAAQYGFLSTNGTHEKLCYADQHGGDTLEIWYLLGVIYNACLHLRVSPDNFTAVESKLENKVIKSMIKSLV